MLGSEVAFLFGNKMCYTDTTQKFCSGGELAFFREMRW